jgi:hypothetical protein
MHCHIPAVLFALVGYMSEVALAFAPPEGCQSINNRISKSNVAVRLISEKQTANQAGSRRSAAEKIQALLVDADTEAAEYIVIPQIWETALAVSKAKDDEEITSLLQIAIPNMDEPLRHWQAVVLGGSIINGLTQAGVWPRTRVERLLGDDKALMERWRRTLRLAAEMAGDARVRSGTRYDALRILGVDSYERSQKRLMPYLKKGAHPELQMGAVSALGDINEPRASNQLLLHLEELTDSNRELAIDALLRTDERAKSLFDRMNNRELARIALNPRQQTLLDERTKRQIEQEPKPSPRNAD